MDFKKLFTECKKEIGIICIIMLILSAGLSFFAYQKGGKDFDKEVIKQEARLMESFQPNYDNMKKEYEDMQSDYDIKMKLITKYEEDIADMETQKSDLTSIIEENQEIIEKINNSETIVSELETVKVDLQSDVDSLEISVKNLESKKESLQDEIDKLNGELVEAAGAPIELKAGMWFQDIDEIPIGRYTVSNGDSNFFVYDSSGYAYVNIILDDSESGWGVTEYTFVLTEGAIIENNEPCTLTPVK